MSFQSALMSWRDRGFSKEHLDKDGKERVNLVLDEVGNDCEVVREMVVNEMQRIASRLNNTTASFYHEGVIYDKDFNEIDMSEYPDIWVKLMGNYDLTSLEDLKKLLEEKEIEV